MAQNFVKRKVKDTVFCNLFKNKKYLLQLYNTLHPKDIEITEDDLTYLTLTHVLVNGLYNDLGFMAKDKLIILVEAQSTWSPNILIRALMYLIHTYQNYFRQKRQRLYGSTRINMPIPELYVVYTGRRDGHPDVLSLQKEFFNGENICIEATAKVIYLDDSDSIINQYIKFCLILNEQVRKHGRTRKAITETIRICKDKNLLREYLEQREAEVEDIMITLFDQEWENELEREHFGEHKFKEGEAKGKVQDAKNLVAKGIVTFTQLEGSGLYTADELSAIAAKN